MVENDTYGITSTGFVVKDIETIIEEKKTRLRDTFGPDIDLTPTSPVAAIIETDSYLEHQIWLLAEELYYSQFFSTASGSSLDDLALEVGVDRKQEVQAQVTLAFRSSSNELVTVPSGTIVTTEDGVSFQSTAELRVHAGNLNNLYDSNYNSLKSIGSISRTASKDYLPSPHDLNTNIKVVTVTENALDDDDAYPTGSKYVYADPVNEIASTDNGLFSYGYRENVTFVPKSDFESRAHLLWNDPSRTLRGVVHYDDDGGTSYTDIIGTANVFGTSPAANDDYIYFGSERKFCRMTFDVDTAATGATLIFEIEYYNGFTWTTLTNFNDGTSGFTADGTIVLGFTESSWTNWTRFSLSDADDTALEDLNYWIRFKITQLATGMPTLVTDHTTSTTLDNGVIPSTGSSYYIGVLGNQWDSIGGQAIVAGTDGNVEEETITFLTSSIRGLSGVTNPSSATGGADRETDASLTARLVDYPRSFWTGASIQSRILSITGVDSASVVEGNITNETVISSLRLTPDFVARYRDDIAASEENEDSDAKNATLDDVKVYSRDGDLADAFLLLGSEYKFSRINIVVSTAADLISGSLQLQIYKDTGWTNIGYFVDTSSNLTSVGTHDLIMQFDGDEFGAWTASTLSTVGMTTDLDTIERYFVRITYSNTTAFNASTYPLLQQVTLYADFVQLEKTATDPGNREGIRRVTVQKADTGVESFYTDEDDSSYANISNSSEFWCDYNSPSTVFFFKDVLEPLDIVKIDYMDNEVGGNSIKVVVLPTSPPMTTTLFNSIYDVLVDSTPVGTSFKIIEAEPLTIQILGSLSYNTVDYSISDLNSDIFTQVFQNYFTNLLLGEDVVRNKVIKEIMSVDGVDDITLLVFKITNEQYEGNATEVEIKGAKIYPYVGSGNYGTSITVDMDGDGSNIVDWVEGTDYTITAASGSSNGKINVISSLNAESTYTFLYYTTEGNISPDETIIASLDSVNFT